eukprot:TRINITY_DN9085_c0_g1_i3.p2 TRINITY_DN9085_c0_g1~~TRINITY_DN9085_c0_g1_i3.p2  ORF type:complete len:238 (-),score=52.33 TRINITY_DN9085_c0_g1_i3:204-917(-)
MGQCSSGNSQQAETTIQFTEGDVEKVYVFIFDQIFESSKDMLEVEMVTRQELMPVSDEMLQGLCGVAAIQIAVSQFSSPHEGIVILPGSGHVANKANAPAYFKDVVDPLVDLKDALVKSSKAEPSFGEMNKLKQIMLFAFTDRPLKVWGSCLVQYEVVLDNANAIARAMVRLPEYPARKDAVKVAIEQMAKDKPVAELKFGKKEDDDDDAPNPAAHSGAKPSRATAALKDDFEFEDV